MDRNILTHQFGSVELIGSARTLWRYTINASRKSVDITPPVFEINGKQIVARLENVRPIGRVRKLINGARESVFRGEFEKNPGLYLQLTFRVVPANPVIRFKYELQSNDPIKLTKSSGHDELEYFSYSVRGLNACKEIHLSEFDESIHSFRLIEHELHSSAFENSSDAMGPILLAGNEKQSILSAYEHGSQVPDAYLNFQLAPNRSVALRAIKGNYHNHRTVDPEHPFDTLWFQFAAIDGGEKELAPLYRDFVLRHMTENLSSRQPYIFYNTWNYQERNKWWNGRTFLESLTEKRMLDEIEVAHKMGIEVFVIDTGWYQKTGDWEVNLKKFSSNLGRIKNKLDAYEMKLGLWFSPTESAVSSRLSAAHLNERISKDGKVHDPSQVWETEDSYKMCLVSSYWESFADELIRLCREVGVVYFKWDAVGQYGCNDPRHYHGGKMESASERLDCYAFEQVRYMQRIIDKLGRECPEAIVDFDITEGWRSVGLGFLASGKYFLINNGSYFSSYDFPPDYFSPEPWSNVFVFPGPARTRVCRAPLDFDKWIPSILFLTHYLPDDPASSQINNIASLILGQNGIWGDLLAISKEGVARFGEFLSFYKQVRDDVTASSPVRSGVVGGSPEVHEKISSKNGRGAVCLFGAVPGTFTYITTNKVAKTHWTHEGVSVTHLKSGQAKIVLSNSREPSAGIVYFGVR